MLDDFVPAPNIGRHPDLYQRENEALARDGRLDSALQSLAPFVGRTLLDVGSGTGFWLSRYAEAGATRVVGVEPDPSLRARWHAHPGTELLAGSAEHLPLPDRSVDVVHARFAYFFGPGCEAGLAEVRRVLRPGGTFLAVDNSWEGGDFAWLLRHATTGNAAMDPAGARRWWEAQGAERHEVEGGWQANDPDELEAILRIEFPGPTVDAYLQSHPRSERLSYHFAVYRTRV